MVDLLFTYGTLMQDFNSQITHLLRRQSRFLGEGYIRGRLYDLGAYPGLVYDPSSRQQVRGEIYKLLYPDSLLSRLDEYEMIDPARPMENEYRRSLVPIWSKEQELACWTYLFQLSTAPFLEITSGDYRNYFAQNPSHQAFIDKN